MKMRSRKPRMFMQIQACAFSGAIAGVEHK
jgi:hypothetical protein